MTAIHFSKVLILRVAPFVIGPVLFVVATELASVELRTVGPDGLTLILIPYWDYVWALDFIILGLLAFGVALNLSKARRLGRSVAGAAMFGMAAPSLAYTGLMLWYYSSNYAVRCIEISCPPFLQQYFGRILLLSMLGAAGIIVFAGGTWLLFKRSIASNQSDRGDTHT